MDGPKRLSQEAELLREQRCHSRVGGGEEDLATRVHSQVAKVVKERQSVEVVDVRDRVVDEQHGGRQRSRAIPGKED